MNASHPVSHNFLVMKEICERRDGMYVPPTRVLSQRLHDCISESGESIMIDDDLRKMLFHLGVIEDVRAHVTDRTVGDVLCSLQDYWIDKIAPHAEAYQDVFLSPMLRLACPTEISPSINRLFEYVAGRPLTDIYRQFAPSWAFKDQDTQPQREKGQFKYSLAVDQSYLEEHQEDDGAYEDWQVFETDVMLSNNLPELLCNLDTLIESRLKTYASNPSAKDLWLKGFWIEEEGKMVAVIPISMKDYNNRADLLSEVHRQNKLGLVGSVIDYTSIRLINPSIQLIETIRDFVPNQHRYQFMAQEFTRSLGM